MDDLDDLQASEFVTDAEDQDSLDERIDSEQRIRNQQLWASFQNAACCITKLYNSRAQSNIPPWIPFQTAASNLTTLYKDCIESQKRFARIGYQHGRRRRVRDVTKLLKKHKIPSKQMQTLLAAEYGNSSPNDSSIVDDLTSGQHNNVSSILAVNQLKLNCDETPSNSMQVQQSDQHALSGHHLTNQQSQQQQQQSQHQQNQQQLQSNLPILLGNNEEDLVIFQQALAQPNVTGKTNNQSRKPLNNSRSIDPKTEEERLLELNRFLSEEHYRYVGSRKRTNSAFGGGPIKRFRE